MAREGCAVWCLPCGLELGWPEDGGCTYNGVRAPPGPGGHHGPVTGRRPMAHSGDPGRPARPYAGRVDAPALAAGLLGAALAAATLLFVAAGLRRLLKLPRASAAALAVGLLLSTASFVATVVEHLLGVRWGLAP